MTSGVLIVAKNNNVHKSSVINLKKNNIKKYICLCWNKLPKNDGTIVENIARSRFNRKK